MKTNPLDPTLRNLKDCGCCAGTGAETPAAIENRPGLPIIAFRAGTHARFKASLLAALSDAKRAQLGRLRTREDDDFTTALLDGFAAMADVLTFYSERIANEGFLRTATERRSVLELARAIGYELNPGVAASTWLAFTVEDAPGAPGFANIPKGTKIQSVPGPDEKPQVYETVEGITARKEWNELKPRRTAPPQTERGLTRLYLAGTNTQLQPGDAILIVGDERLQHPGYENWDFRILQTVTPDRAHDRTLVTWAKGLGWRKSSGKFVDPARKNVTVFAFRQRAALFGHNAPDWRAMPTATRQGFVAASPVSGLLGEYFDNVNLVGRKFSRIDAMINFVWGADSPHPSIPADNFSVRWSGWLKPPATAKYTFYANSDDGVRLWVNGQLIVDNWTDHPAQEDSGSIDLEEGRFYDIRLEYYERGGAAVIQLKWSSSAMAKGIVPADRLFAVPDEWPNFNIAYSASVPTTLNTVYLDATYPKIRKDSWLVLDRPGYTELYRVTDAVTGARADFTLTAKVSVLILDDTEHLANFGLRTTVAFAQSEELELAETPLTSPVGGSAIDLDHAVAGLERGRRIIVQGKPRAQVQVAAAAKGVSFVSAVGVVLQADSSGSVFKVIESPLQEPDGTEVWHVADQSSRAGFLRTKPQNLLVVATNSGDPQIELAVIKELTGNGTTLVLDPGNRTSALEHTYAPESVTLFANVAPATHGETVEEIIGHGDASKAHQQFALKQAPLTFTPANTPTGVESSLEAFVNDVKWPGADSLFARGRRERVFVARRENDGTTRLIFGNGQSGALLPTGRENIRARYRKGVGLAGNVKAGQLTLLMNRPLGVKSVTNPAASGGAQDPEQLDDARRNAPLQTLTLGRIVSLQDYEDFARAFGGIAKAHATWVWTPRERGVFVTVMLPGGAPPPPADTTLDRLKKALHDFGNPLVPVKVVPGTLKQFALRGEVIVHPDRIPEKVKAGVDAVLREQFKFDARQLGQNLALSEVIALIQNVLGVESVTLTKFDFALPGGGADLVKAMLVAKRPQAGDALDAAKPAEVLVLAEDSLPALEVKPV